MAEAMKTVGNVLAPVGTFLDVAMGVKNLFGGSKQSTPEPMRPMVPQTPPPPVLPVRDDVAVQRQREVQLAANKGSRAGTYLTGDGSYGSNSGFN